MALELGIKRHSVIESARRLRGKGYNVPMPGLAIGTVRYKRSRKGLEAFVKTLQGWQYIRKPYTTIANGTAD